MRKILVIAVLAATLGGYTLQSQLAQKNGQEVESIQTNGATARFVVDTTPLDRSQEGLVTSYAPIIEKATPAVVTVASSSMVRILRDRYSNPMEEFLRRFYGIPGPNGGAPAPQGESERLVPNGLGSGVIVSADGYILTNNHVVTDSKGNPADEITVALTDGREFTAELVGRDPKTDVALLRIEANNLPVLAMADSDQLRVGDVVFAIGNPMGLSQTVTMGIVSATGRSRLGILGSEGYENFIQTDASINPGNSGGALIDAAGRLVGINTAIFSRSGGNVGIGFAVPITLARSIIESLIETGTVRRGFLGVSISDLDADMAAAFNLEDTRGVLVESVQPDSPAAEGGVERGDVIISIDGKRVSDVNELRLRVAQTLPGTVVQLEVIRNGEPQKLSVTLGDMEGSVSDDGGAMKILEGVTLQTLNDQLRQALGVDESQGVVITAIEPNSPYARTLAEGMVILELNDAPVTSVAEFRELLRPAVNKLWVSYRGNRGYIALRVR